MPVVLTGFRMVAETLEAAEAVHLLAPALTDLPACAQRVKPA